MAKDRRELESKAAASASRAKEIESDINEARRDLAAQQSSLERDRASGKECETAARTGVEFLQLVVRWLELSAQNDQTEADDVRSQINRLIAEANQATRACERGLL